MSSGIQIVSELFFQNPFHMALSQHDNVIQAFSANTSDEPFGKGILPRTFRRGEHLLDSHSLNPVSEMATVYAVAIPYQISRCSVIWKGFDDLLRRPFGRGMLRDIQMQHAATFMRHTGKTNNTLKCSVGTVKKSMICHSGPGATDSHLGCFFKFEL